MATDSAQRLQEIVDNLPDQVEGWRKAESEIYTRDNLHQYINGGAELYISFRFEALLSLPYVRDDGTEVRLDIFDMGSAANAYGIFCHSREAVDNFVGPEVDSEYAAGLLHFWKGRYYASALGYPETASSRALIRELAQGIVEQIGDASGPPAVVALLPEADLVPYSIRYFRHYAWLNDYHNFGDGNPLHLYGDAEAALARYNVGTEDLIPAVLLVVSYPNAGAAETAHEDFISAITPTAEDGLQAMAQGDWLGSRQFGNLVIVVAAPNRDAAGNLMRACAERRPLE
jgi:hypothetical protein